MTKGEKARTSAANPMDVDNDRTPKRRGKDRPPASPQDESAAANTVQGCYMTVKVVLRASDEILNDLRSKYVQVLEIAQEADASAKLLPVNPKVTGDAIASSADIPNSNTALLKYFDTNSKLNKKGGTIWSTALFSFDADVEDIINRTSYDLERQKINLSKKRLQHFRTRTPGHLLFIKNTLDTCDVGSSIKSDLILQNSTPTFTPTYDFIVYTKEPWSGYKKDDKSRSKKQMQWSKTFHLECEADSCGETVDDVRKWIKSGMAATRFGEHVRFVEAITPKTSDAQKDRTMRMNAQGQRFQASVGKTILHGLILPDTKLTILGKKPRPTKTIRQIILEKKSVSGNSGYIQGSLTNQF